MMLQQTQVERVVPYYKKFLKQFPTAEALAGAPLSSVLAAWQGLGYNRRAKYLRQAATVLARERFVGQKLPGVGPYTRSAVLVFAFNKPEILVETNIRTVVLYHHFRRIPAGRAVPDKAILPIVKKLLETSNMQPRDFYAALMDYGAHLKRRGVRLNSKSKHYTKQGAFKGSTRELRGAILRALLAKPYTCAQLTNNLSRERGEVEAALDALAREGLIRSVRGRFRVV